MSQKQTLQTIKFIAKETWNRLLLSKKIHDSWWWIVTIFLPFQALCLLMTVIVPRHKNPYFTTSVYDGQTRNDFKRGTLLRYLHQLNCIKRLDPTEDNIDDRNYFIGYPDED